MQQHEQHDIDTIATTAAPPGPATQPLTNTLPALNSLDPALPSPHTPAHPIPNPAAPNLPNRSSTDLNNTTNTNNALNVHTKAARRASITDTVLAGAATAASSAATAASSVVAAARKLVLHNEDGKEGLDAVTDSSDDHHGLEFSQRHLSARSRKKRPQTPTAAPIASIDNSTPNTNANTNTNTDTSSNTNPIINTIGNPNDSVTGVTSPSTASGLNVINSGVATETRPSVASSGISTPVHSSDLDAAGDSIMVVGTPAATDALTKGVDPLSHGPDMVSKGQGVAAPSDSIAGPTDQGRSLLDRERPIDAANAPTNSGIDSSNNSNNEKGSDDNDNRAWGPSPTRSAHPINTMYVSHRGPDSIPHQAMNVDLPSVSHTLDSPSTRTGMGVDVPRLVGEPADPHNRQKGGLHVDSGHKKIHNADGHEIHVPHHHHDDDSELGSSIQTSKDNSKVIYGNDHHRTQNGLPEAKAAINKNPFEAHMSHHRDSVSSGMNVDHPVVPTSKLAGSGSSDITNHNRPPGTYNSAINVDRAGASDVKRSGMGVDSPAVVTHHLAHAHDHLQNPARRSSSIFSSASHKSRSSEKKLNSGSSPTGTNLDNQVDGDREKGIGKLKNVFRRRSSSRTLDSVNSATKASGGVVASGLAQDATSAKQGPLSNSPSSLTHPFSVPAGYEGPIPQVGQDEEVIWVKRIIQTEYYDDSGNDNEEGGTATAEVQHHESNQDSRQHMSLLDRLRGRHHPSVKGKQRV
ncbi:hypothetical protein BC939DRAFT_443077 [Gamsiella multidivaricata]|uniref:uncharacterized protein n=1 Tax=Gamsiella multidivaricata TaxID=101098 RepID=UPI00221E7D8B|nr:uncharacterized protein BC939DRAFT_443077 [Gamsiella multidivaricata]KAI7828839.1 hypothetical protein BC939DRAFT_443077 [Gamsiella multidivaricata]